VVRIDRRGPTAGNGLVRVLIGLLAIGFTISATAQDFPLRPDDSLTPGVVASTDADDVCGIVDGLTYSKRHRHTSPELKREVYAAYHVDHAGREFEMDHRVPLCLGGADVRENLWPQAGWQHPSYHDKDVLEETVCRMVCRDHTMTLEEGQAVFLGDWQGGYLRILGHSP
jgi:hypothetical protein